MELSSFFDRLRLVLRDREMSQADLARRLDVGNATVSEWFTRGRAPQGDVLLRLPSILEINGHWLLTGEGPRDLTPAEGNDPYRQGIRETLSRLRAHIDELESRHGLATDLEESPTAPRKESRTSRRPRDGTS